MFGVSDADRSLMFGEYIDTGRNTDLKGSHDSSTCAYNNHLETLSTTIENGTVAEGGDRAATEVDGIKVAYDFKCTVHSKWYPEVVSKVTEDGADPCGHPARLTSDNPERVPGHIKCPGTAHMDHEIEECTLKDSPKRHKWSTVEYVTF